MVLKKDLWRQVVIFGGGERIEKLSAGKRTASRRQENDLNSHEMVHDLVVDLSLNSLNITRQDRSARVLLWIDTFFFFFFFLVHLRQQI
jgi:hypothetical protein